MTEERNQEESQEQEADPPKGGEVKFPAITMLSKPVTRRIGRIIVQITADGIRIRGHRKKLWKEASWTRVLSLFADDSYGATPEINQHYEEQLGVPIRDKMENPCRPTKTRPTTPTSGKSKSTGQPESSS